MSATTAPDQWHFLDLAKLVPPLAQYYPSKEDWRRVVSDAGMNTSNVEFDGTASTFWFALVMAAEPQGRVKDLIRVALEEHPEDDVLRQAAPAPASTPEVQVAQPAPVGDQGPPFDSEEPDTPFVDRENLMALLAGELEAISRDRTGRVRLLIGDSGVGKSRLAQRTARLAHESGMMVLQAQCRWRGSEALMPFRESLGAVRERLLSELPPESQQFLRTFLGIGDVGTAGPQLGSQDIYEGLARALLGLAGRRGLCLVVEDLTDADRDTLYFLEYFHRKATSDRLLTLSTVKQDLVGDELQELLEKWRADGCAVSKVPPLGPDHAAELVALRWRGDPLPDEQVRRVAELSHGNPFFIEQLLDLVEKDPTVDASLTGVPPRIQAVLERRLARIDDDTRHFLRAAAVALEAGPHVGLIAHVAGVDAPAGQALLRRARAVGCLTDDAAGGTTFVQELLRRVVYEGTDVGERRLLHTRAGEWLEAAELLSSAAHHYHLAVRTDDLVRTAEKGGEREEHRGLYRAALQLYELMRPHVDLRAIGPRIAKAHIALGQLRQADELLDELPADDVDVRALRSELSFMRGDFSGALEEIELALQSPAADRAKILLQLGSINLYLGELDRAALHGNEVLAEGAEPTAIARAQGLLGAAAFFAGDVDGGEAHYLRALSFFSSQPVEERDRRAYTTNLENLGHVSQVRGHWEAAKRLHTEALILRREVSDARGELHSIHSVALCEIGLGAVDTAVSLVDEARRLATVLEDPLEIGKLDHTLAQLALARNDPTEAVSLAENALKAFRRSQVAYDVAHARFTLARAFAASGAHRRAVEEGARARMESTRKGFGLLRRLYPELGFSFQERIEAGLLAYACGDALGLPWEGKPPNEIDMARVPSLPDSRDWTGGSTSDDTALTLLVADHLVVSRPPDPIAFMDLLASRAPEIPGLGPSTTKAIEHFRATGAAPTEGGNTNGTVMRSLPVGWALPLDRFQDRRSWSAELSRVTHPGPDACCAAAVGAACAAWAVESASPQLLLDVAIEEARAVTGSCRADARLADLLTALAGGRWAPGPSGIGLDPNDTLVAALWCITTAPSLPEALLKAVSIGGDTDTVAALVGGLRGCQMQPDEVRAALPWFPRVQLPDASRLSTLAGGLAELRVRRVDA